MSFYISFSFPFPSLSLFPTLFLPVLNDDGIGRELDVTTAIYLTSSSPLPLPILVMSFGGTDLPSLEPALRFAVSRGAVPVAAAGNDNSDACLFVPANSGHVVTVGAVDVGGHVAGYSNYGVCVDVWAPGTGVESVGVGEESRESSGTRYERRREREEEREVLW